MNWQSKDWVQVNNSTLKFQIDYCDGCIVKHLSSDDRYIEPYKYSELSDVPFKRDILIANGFVPSNFNDNYLFWFLVENNYENYIRVCYDDNNGHQSVTIVKGLYCKLNYYRLPNSISEFQHWLRCGGYEDIADNLIIEK